MITHLVVVVQGVLHRILDYSFENSTTRILSNGKYETEINIKKIGTVKMPIEVSVKTKNGLEVHKIIPGIKSSETVRFLTDSFIDKISLDPDEKLLETFRINNHSFFAFFRS